MTNLRDAIASNRAKRPAKPRRKTEEHSFQVSVIAYLEAVLPSNAVVFSIDHANAFSQATGAERKRRGVIPGIADVYVSWHACTLWIECKKPKGGKLSDDQEAFCAAVLEIGHHWCAPRTLEEVEVALRRTPIFPLRGAMVRRA